MYRHIHVLIINIKGRYSWWNVELFTLTDILPSQYHCKPGIKKSFYNKISKLIC